MFFYVDWLMFNYCMTDKLTRIYVTVISCLFSNDFIRHPWVTSCLVRGVTAETFFRDMLFTKERLSKKNDERSFRKTKINVIGFSAWRGIGDNSVLIFLFPFANSIYAQLDNLRGFTNEQISNNCKNKWINFIHCVGCLRENLSVSIVSKFIEFWLWSIELITFICYIYTSYYGIIFDTHTIYRKWL